MAKKNHKVLPLSERVKVLDWGSWNIFPMGRGIEVGGQVN